MIANARDGKSLWMTSWRSTPLHRANGLLLVRALRLLRAFGWLCMFVAVSWGLAGCSTATRSARSDAPSAFGSAVSRKMGEELPTKSDKAQTEVTQLNRWIRHLRGQKHGEKEDLSAETNLKNDDAGVVRGGQQDRIPANRNNGTDVRTNPSQPESLRPAKALNIVTVQKRPWWAPPPPRAMTYRQLSPKERICRSAEMICRISERICKIAARHPERPLFRKSCIQAQKDCLEAQKQCKAAN